MNKSINRIESFKVDHRKLYPGIYVSRVDGDITTYDLRFRRPNSGDYIDDISMHSVEHMMATYLRNSQIADDVLYFGPMGCRTGFYLLVRNAENLKVLEAVKEALCKVISHDGGVFGASEAECGNFRCLSLECAVRECSAFLSILKEKESTFKYNE